MAAVKKDKVVKKEVVEQSIASVEVANEIVKEEKSSSEEKDYAKHLKFAKFNQQGDQ